MRKGLLTIGALVLIVGTVALLTGLVASSIVYFFWGGMLILLILIERFRYKGLARNHPGPGWERTTERFVDEETGKLVTVFIKPETGERIYVQD